MQCVAYFIMYRVRYLLIPFLILEVGHPSPEGPQGRLFLHTPSGICPDSTGGLLDLVTAPSQGGSGRQLGKESPEAVS